MHALVIDGQIQALGRLPRSARRLDTGEWVMGLDSAPLALVHACGWHEVQDAERPPDTETHTHERSVEVVDGVPAVVWTPRAWTAEEVEARNAPPARVRTYALKAALKLALMDPGSGVAMTPEAAVEMLPEPQRTVAREGLGAPWIDRDHALTHALAAVMGLSSEQVDGFFRQAHDLSVS